MTLPSTSASPTADSVTDYEQVDFARLCANTQSSDLLRSNPARYRLASLPPERARSLLTALWRAEEPRRRRWAVRHTFFQQAARCCLWSFPLAVAVAVLLFVWQVHQAFTILIVPGALWYHFTFLAEISSGCVPDEAQRGGFTLLTRLQTPRFVGFWVDVLDFRLEDKELPEKKQVYQILADLLPGLSETDAPPLDPYQQQVLLRHLDGFRRRLRRRTVRLGDYEARFIVAALHYLSMHHEPSLGVATLRVIQRFAALPPGGRETKPRRLVRDVASDCLLWCR